MAAFLGGPHNTDYSMLESVLGSPSFLKLSDVTKHWVTRVDLAVSQAVAVASA